MLNSFIDKLLRKKNYSLAQHDILDTPLQRCLNLFDLTLFGIGNMVGAGIFVVTGAVSKEIAGPGVIISFLIAGIAAILSALCYAEFGARVPKTGSAYIYTYVCIGEIFAFLIGWTMLLEFMIGASSVAKAWSGSVDAVFNKTISKGILNTVGRMNVPFLSKYPDFLALACVLFWTCFIAAGAKLTTLVNNIFTLINVVLLSIIFVTGLYFADLNNWKNENEGGFLPYGISGVVAGSASCFYAYVGFESIAIAGEETNNPARNIPIALGLSVIVASFLYLGASTSLTLIVPYYAIDLTAPFPNAFRVHGAYWATYVVGIGTIISLSSSLIGALFVIPRSLYAMASDGLLFKAFAYIHPKTQTPLFATIVAGVLTSIMAFLVDLDILVELLSIGTLLCFTMVDINVIILRYLPVSMCQFQLKPNASNLSLDSLKSEPDDTIPYNNSNEKDKVETISINASLISQPSLLSSQSYEDIGKLKPYFKNLPLLQRIPPGKSSIISICLMVVFITSSWSIIIFANKFLAESRWWAILLLILCLLGFLGSFGLLCMYEQNVSFLTFQVPWVPLLPVLSICINIGMMLKLNLYTWIRLLVWILIGFIIYFAYGFRHSLENDDNLLSYKTVKISYNGTDKKMDDSSKFSALPNSNAFPTMGSPPNSGALPKLNPFPNSSSPEASTETR